MNRLFCETLTDEYCESFNVCVDEQHGQYSISIESQATGDCSTTYVALDNVKQLREFAEAILKACANFK